MKEDLDTLVSELKRAVAVRDRRAQQRLHSKAGLFAMSWEEQVVGGPYRWRMAYRGMMDRPQSSLPME